ncbi:hypothetical protein [Nocardia amikacinitolerans]|uniref:hypothetical protein n=1 Tax=Nocardia amikacinitolerans TaxID=756689 RepID=UPI0020A3E605|nr:hypothetical protein [Nocardia amikacinitolerans]MCP2290797.1 hypothetical protein [Nocardia amikacinitolerans]
MVARDGAGTRISRTVTSCGECLAWGPTYAQGVCLACYNLAARYGDHVEVCPGCRRRVPLKDGYCRLCWCQARLDRAADAENARDRVVLAPYASRVRYHQLFLADLYQPHAPPRAVPRRRGTAGRPPKPAPPVASRPSLAGAQLTLLTDLPRTYRPSQVDLRSVAAPDNPWLAWALHLAWTTSEAHGFDAGVRRALNRNLIMLLATHVDGDLVRVSQFHRLVRRRGALIHVIDVLSSMGILLDDRPPVFDNWLDAKLDGLAPGIARPTEGWIRALRDGGPRRPRREPSTAMAYLNAARPALLTWSTGHDHLREITREQVFTHLAALRGESRRAALGALRSLFAWAKRQGVIFRNPCARIRHAPRVRPIWQRLSDEQIANALHAANTPQARVCVALAAVFAARPGQIRTLMLDDVDLGNRHITLAGRTLPLDELSARVLGEWLDHRRTRWPRTANPHLLVSKESALRTGPVSATFLQNLRGLTATLERLRIDRHLEEALACGADPLHLSVVFGLSDTTALRWATNAHQLLSDPHAADSSGSTPTRAPNSPNGTDDHSDSR